MELKVKGLKDTMDLIKFAIDEQNYRLSLTLVNSALFGLNNLREHLIEKLAEEAAKEEHE